MNQEQNQQIEPIIEAPETSTKNQPDPLQEIGAKNAYSAAGFALAATEGAKQLAVIAVVFLSSIAFYFMGIDTDSAVGSVYFGLGLTLIVIYFVGFPLMYAMMKNRPTQPPERKKMPSGKIFLYFFMCLPLVFAGGMVSTIIDSFMDLIFGVGTGGNPASEIIEASQSLTQVIFMLVLVVILAPIFEELVFRKLLIDRLRQYGKWPAIVMSSIAFGLFHGNVAQMVYAAFVGLILGVIYERYGNVWHVIILHFLINFFAAVPITIFGVLEQRGILTEETMEYAEGALGLLMLSMAAVGLAFLIIELNKKEKLPQDRQLYISPEGMLLKTEAPLGWRASLTAPGMVMYYIVAAIILVLNTLTMVL